MKNGMIALCIITVVTVHGNFYASQAPKKETNISKPTDTVAQQEIKEKQEDYSHLKPYVGEYATTEDFKLLERAKKICLDLNAYTKKHDKDAYKDTSESGIGFLMAFILLQESSDLATISEQLKQKTTQQLKDFCTFLQKSSPSNESMYKVWNLSKPLIYHSMQSKNINHEVASHDALTMLNEHLASYSPTLYCDGKQKIWLNFYDQEDNTTFLASKLTQENILDLLKKSGYTKLEPARSCQLVMHDCNEKKNQENTTVDLQSLCTQFNDNLDQKKPSFTFTSLRAEYPAHSMEAMQLIYAVLESSFFAATKHGNNPNPNQRNVLIAFEKRKPLGIPEKTIKKFIENPPQECQPVSHTLR